MKSVYLLSIIILFSGCTQEKSMRHKIADALGGMEQLKQLDGVKYSITRYKISGQDTIVEKRWYSLNSKLRLFREKKLVDGDTVISTHKAGQSFVTRSGRTEDLDLISSRSLYHSMYYNFLYLFVADHTVWKEVGDYEFQSKSVKIVSVKDMQGIADEIHLFVDPENGQILGSSTPENGQYTYFANEYDYQLVSCLSISFPMRYEVEVAGKVTTWGVFDGFCD